MNITEIHNTIEKKGYIEIPKFLHNDEFESLKKFVDEKIESIDNNFFLTDNSLNKIFIQNNEIYKKLEKIQDKGSFNSSTLQGSNIVFPNNSSSEKTENYRKNF